MPPEKFFFKKLNLSVGSFIPPWRTMVCGHRNGSAAGSLLRKSSISHCCNGNLRTRNNLKKKFKQGAKQLDEGEFFLPQAIPSLSSPWGVGACAAGHNTAIPPMKERPHMPAPGTPPCSQQHLGVSSHIFFPSDTFLTKLETEKVTKSVHSQAHKKNSRSHQEPNALKLCVLET